MHTTIKQLKKLKLQQDKILSIFLLSLLTLSVVSAADNATNDVISLEESKDIISIEKTQTIGQSEESKLMGPDNGTFTDLQRKIDNANASSTILLENNYKYNDGFDKNGIKITKNLTIEGRTYLQCLKRFFCNI